MKLLIFAGLIFAAFLPCSEGSISDDGSINNGGKILFPEFNATTCTKDMAEAPDNDKRCYHGCFSSVTYSCHCLEGWHHAGPTDTFNWISGVCSQSTCIDDKTCMKDLDFAPPEKATCKIRGWNCKCSWARALEQFPAGYQNEKAHCMNVMFLLSFEMADLTLWLMKWIWMVFLLAIIVALPCGQNHVRCQHHDPDMFKVFHATGVLKFFGWDYGCHGRCSPGDHTCMWKYYYNFAWSLYIFDLGIWVYGFLFVAFCTFLVSWAIALWLMVFLMIVVAGIVALVGGVLACLGDGGGGGDCDCKCDGCDCCANGGHADCCECSCCDTGGAGEFWMYNSLGSNTDVFWYGQMNDGCCDCQCPKCTSVCIILKPLAWIIHKFPRWPPNMWGGFVGFWIFQTHSARSQRNPPLYTYAGGDTTTCWHKIINFFGRLRHHSGEQYRQESWRERVHAFLLQDFNESSGAVRPTQIQMVNGSRRTPAALRQDEMTGMVHSNRPDIPDYQFISGPGGRKVALIDTKKPFNRETMFIVDSSWQDYIEGKCWICMCVEDKFHLWTNCGHIFGEGASSEMLRRGMPCPLCREISPVVKIGTRYRPERAYQPPPVNPLGQPRQPRSS